MVENELSILTHKEQRFAVLHGAKALQNRKLFYLARNFHYNIKNNSDARASAELLPLFRAAIKYKNFANVRQFVDILDDWTADAVVILKGNHGFGYERSFAKDPVGTALLKHSDVTLWIGPPSEDEVCQQVRTIRKNKVGCTAKQLLKWIQKHNPGFDCDIKTIRNRAKELGLKLAPDRRGLRKGQKRNHVHRVQR